MAVTRTDWIWGNGEDYKLWSNANLNTIQEQWKNLVQRLKPYKFSYIRLASHYKNSTGTTSGASTLDWPTMDAIIAQLEAEGYKIVFDATHNFADHYNWVGSEGWHSNLKEQANRFAGTETIIELVNEPKQETWASNISSERQLLAECKKAIQNIRNEGFSGYILMPLNVSTIKSTIPAADYNDPLLDNKIIFNEHPWSYRNTINSQLEDADRRVQQMLDFRDAYGFKYIAGEFGAASKSTISRDGTIQYNIKLINLLLRNKIGGLWWQWSRNHGYYDFISEEIFNQTGYSGPAAPPPANGGSQNPFEIALNGQTVWRLWWG